MDIDSPIHSQATNKPTYASIALNSSPISDPSNPNTQPFYASITLNSSTSNSAKPQAKSTPTFDWLLNYPITDKMKPHTKLQTPFAQQLYYLFKKHLHNFYPGTTLKAASENKQPLKASFYHIIHCMASKQPDFLTNYIYQINSSISNQATIPFNILEDTLKKIILKFTNIFFTKLNYLEIYASPATISPYKPENRLQFGLNLARLHLYLSGTYQAIDYNKFADNLNL